jgi:ketosteroid isomerase-like protein
MPNSQAEIARKGFEAAASGNFDALGEILDPHVKWHGGDEHADGACRNRDEAVTFIRRAHERGTIGELVDVVDAGDRIVIIMRVDVATDEDAGLRANLATFRDGRVVEMVHYPDPAEALAVARESLS